MKSNSNPNAPTACFLCDVFHPLLFFSFCCAQTGAKAYHVWLINIQRSLAGIEPRAGSTTPRISEAQAVDLASALLAEGVVYSIGGLVIVFEYQRSVTNEQNRVAKHKEEMQAMRDDIQSLSARIAKIEEDKQSTKADSTQTEAAVAEELAKSATDDSQQRESGRWLWRRSAAS